MNDTTHAWVVTLRKILADGADVGPRGRPTKELQHHTFKCAMADPVVKSAERGLSYKFMAAEALWILNGDNSVAGIAPYNSRISEFSDDGKTFFGAYGPRVVDQLDYVVNALLKDRETRQAVMTTWRRNPPATKDVPCTVALAFMARHGRLHCHAFMRSSDAWLGLPYDVFNFTMITARVACLVNSTSQEKLELGDLCLTAASSHLYSENFKGAQECSLFSSAAAPSVNNTELQALVRQSDWATIHAAMIACRDNRARQWAKPWVIRPTVMP